MICVALAALGFSIKSILIKLGYGHGVDAPTLMALRMLFSAPFFLVLALWPGLPGANHQPALRDWMHLVALGFIGFYLAAYLDFLGLTYVSAGLERLILFLYPTLVLLLSVWWLKERIHLRQVVALVLSYAGIGLVFVEHLNTGASRGDVVHGGLLIFASAVVYSVFLIGSSRVVHRFGAVRFTSWGMLVGTVFCVVQFLLDHGVGALRLPLPVYGIALTMAVISTVLPAVLMSEGVRRVGANQAALVGTLGPVVTIVLGALVLGEPVGVVQCAGAVLVVAGVLMVSLRPAVVRS
jgi:drug/metabolite transporter (DMT)-like permease